jgi:uncharacterized protein YggT (Ycf19 family)
MRREVNGSECPASVLGDFRRIEWEGDFPADLRSIVEPVFAPLETILPTWCQSVVLRYVSDLDATLKIELSIRNRWALIRVGPSWFQTTGAEREGAMIHEICHALIEPFQWNAARAIEAYGPEDGSPARVFTDQLISDGMEQAVEDMARAMQKLLHGKVTPTSTN